MVEFFALLSAFMFGCAHVSAKKGMRWSNPFTAVLVSIFSGAILLWTAVLLLVPLSRFESPGVLYFVVAGLFAPALGRLFNYTGIHRIGVSRATPVTATAPLFATAIAILFLGEGITPPVIVGTLFIVLGAVLLSHKEKEDRQWRKVDLLFPAVAALCFGISYSLRKLGLIDVPSPLLGATITTTVALLFLLIFSYPNRKRMPLLLDRRSLFYFSLGGCFSGVAALLSYLALNLGTIVVVGPLTNIFPLFGIALSAIFLRDVETVTRWIVAGALVTVLGVIFITLR